MIRTRTWKAALPAAALLVLSTGAGAADGGTGSLRRGYGEFGVARFTTSGDAGVWQGGLRVSTLDTRTPSVDYAFNAWLGVPAVAVVQDLGLAWPVAMGRAVRLVPRAGGSLLLIAGGDLAWASAGGNVGVGLVLSPDRSTSLRVDWTLRRFADKELSDDGDLQSISVGFAW